MGREKCLLFRRAIKPINPAQNNAFAKRRSTHPVLNLKIKNVRLIIHVYLYADFLLSI